MLLSCSSPAYFLILTVAVFTPYIPQVLRLNPSLGISLCLCCAEVPMLWIVIYVYRNYMKPPTRMSDLSVGILSEGSELCSAAAADLSTDRHPVISNYPHPTTGPMIVEHKQRPNQSIIFSEWCTRSDDCVTVSSLNSMAQRVPPQTSQPLSLSFDGSL